MATKAAKMAKSLIARMTSIQEKIDEEISELEEKKEDAEGKAQEKLEAQIEEANDIYSALDDCIANLENWSE